MRINVRIFYFFFLLSIVLVFLEGYSQNKIEIICMLLYYMYIIIVLLLYSCFTE